MKYESPFAGRYGSTEMRGLWSEVAKRRAWRRVWLAAAQAESAAGLIPPEAIDDLRAHLLDIDLERAGELEASVGHDLQAELRTFAEQCPVGGSSLHWGMTSADVQDNAEVVRQRAAAGLLLRRLRELLLILADRIESSAGIAVVGFTHLQPAEPTTLGYRLSAYAQDLTACYDHLARLRAGLRGKGIRGPVGTSATFVDLLAGNDVTPEMLEATVLESLGIEAHAITGQTYPRLQDYRLLAGLAELAAALHKFAFDIRLMQSPGVDQAREPFGEDQVGSSAMPFKRNPVLAERICSLARLVAAGAGVAWENAAQALLERTLDDSANRRSIIPEAFLACDEMLQAASTIVVGLEIDEQAAAAQLLALGPLIATERLLTALVRAGADRQAMYERLRKHSRGALEATRAGAPNPLADRLASDAAILHFIQPARVRGLLDASTYIGRAGERAQRMATTLREKFAAS